LRLGKTRNSWWTAQKVSRVRGGCCTTPKSWPGTWCSCSK